MNSCIVSFAQLYVSEILQVVVYINSFLFLVAE